MPFLGPPVQQRLLHPGLLSDASPPAWPRYPWGQEAFDKARRENKPIFLSGNAPASPGGSGGAARWWRGEGGLPRNQRSGFLQSSWAPLAGTPPTSPWPIPVGYSTCHWCHMMEEESFRNEEIGRLLNEDFVSVKVDREERPDVDKVYMTFVQVHGLPPGGGGTAHAQMGGGVPLTFGLSPPGHQQWWGLAHECVVDSQPPALCGGHLFPP